MVPQHESEQVWGIPREVMERQIGKFQGFLPHDGDLDSCCRRLEPHGSFRPRDEVEEDPLWKQVIPYIVLRHRDKVLRLRRLATQGEKRLHHRISIGVGGHVNPEAAGSAPLLVRGMLRELHEEIAIGETRPRFRILGWINDDETEVGKVHLGLAVEAHLEEMVPIRETDRMEGLWCPQDQLDPLDPGWESWSSLLLPRLDGVAADPTSGVSSC